MFRAVAKRCALYRIIGYKERLLAFKINNINSAFAPLLLANGHAMGRIEEFMDLPYITLKGSVEKYFIYRENKISIFQFQDR